jgi:hypothetical protein
MRAAWALLAIGTSSALGFRFLLAGLPRAGAGPGATAEAITTAFFLGLAVSAVPAGRIALGRTGGGPVTVTGLLLLVAGAVLVPLAGGATAVLLLAALLGAALAALQNGLLAWSLCAVRTERAGLGLGVLLGGGGFGLAAFNLFLSVRKPDPTSALLAAAGLYALTLGLLAVLRHTVRAQPPG